MTPEQIKKVDASIMFLTEAANYFENRPKRGEDGAHWSNVYNSENCRAIAQLLKQLQSEAASPLHPTT